MTEGKIGWHYVRPFFLFFSFVIISNPSTIFAAELRFSNYPSVIRSGDQFSVDVRLSTKGSSVNALEGKLLVSSNLKIQNIKDGQSLVGVWAERPQIQSSNSSTLFSGIIPGGYSGEDGPIFTLDLEATRSGPARIEFMSLALFGNDGVATPVEVISLPFTFVVNSQIGSSRTMRSPDLSPPESFVPAIARNEEIFNNAYFLIFQTVDKQSGVDHYEVAEVSTLGKVSTVSSAWQKTVSPYLLKDQSLQSDIYVRAVDRSGNFIVVKLPARFPGASPQENIFLLWIAVFCLVLVIILLFMKRVRIYLSH